MSRSELYEKYKKIKIYPTKEQKEYIDYCINCSRFVYNWTIDQQTKQYEKYLNHEVKEQFLHQKEIRKLYMDFCSKEENSWLSDFDIEPARYILDRVDYAFQMFFCGYNKRPKFKSKKRDHFKKQQSIRIRHDRFYFDGHYVKIPGKRFKRGEMIDCRYDTGMHKEDNIQFHHVDLIRNNIGEYFVGFYTEEMKPLEHFDSNNIEKSNRAIGIDLNARRNRRFVCSDGDIYEGRDITSNINHIANMNSKISKDLNRFREMEKTNPDTKPSKRAIKRRIKFRKANARLHNIEMDEIHKFTNNVIKKNPTGVVMENLSVREIRQNGGKYYEKAFHYIPISRYREIMEYKCNKYNIPFILAPKTYPSSQLCSNCGNRILIKSTTLTYKCPKCGFKEDRDINAALNLEKLAYR